MACESRFVPVIGMLREWQTATSPSLNHNVNSRRIELAGILLRSYGRHLSGFVNSPLSAMRRAFFPSMSICHSSYLRPSATTVK